MQKIVTQKDNIISTMQTQISKLENRVTDLEDQLDEVNQYERRDTIIIGGSALPVETPNENSTDTVIKTIKDNLHINITHSDINIAHRLGVKKTDLKTTHCKITQQAKKV